MNIKKGNKVYIMTGKDKGKTGEVVRAIPSEDKVLIEGMNMKKVHQKPKKSGGKGEIIEKAYPLHVSNVRLAKDKSKPKVKK